MISNENNGELSDILNKERRKTTKQWKQ